MDTIFMNSKNSKISDPHRLLLKNKKKIDLRRSDKYMALSNLNIYYTWKNIKNSCKNNKFKISAPTQNGDDWWNCLMDHILYKIFKITLNISSKNMRQLLIILQLWYT